MIQDVVHFLYERGVIATPPTYPLNTCSLSGFDKNFDLDILIRIFVMEVLKLSILFISEQKLFPISFLWNLIRGNYSPILSNALALYILSLEKRGKPIWWYIFSRFLMHFEKCTPDGDFVKSNDKIIILRNFFSYEKSGHKKQFRNKFWLLLFDIDVPHQFIFQAEKIFVPKKRICTTDSVLDEIMRYFLLKFI